MKLLSLRLSDAADERLIVANPIRARHRGRRRSDRRVERMWATPSEVLAVADNAARLPIGGPAAALLIVTAAWTGVRCGEIAALQRDNTHLEDGVIVIDQIVGAMIESSRGIELGPPKTAESARTITLPPFLVPLLRAHLAWTPTGIRTCSSPPSGSRTGAATSAAAHYARPPTEPDTWPRPRCGWNRPNPD